ncbi:alpha/beta hydrolase family protein [Algibacter sp. R77976]|uniref:alpha/beta hydrolase family protein n=1 Tax=Algibacter sp. R77976 TaxID=3093873 RepID=UPI0037C7BF87
MKIACGNGFILITILIMIFGFSSCEKQKQKTFHEDIIYQTLLNKTELFNSESIDFFKITYKSEGLKIGGFIAKPIQKKPFKLPTIIFCRGGNQSYGMLDAFQLKMLNDLSLKGFVVLASQLRGNTASEGVDEFGGEDVNDILKLIDIAKDLDFVDEKNINILGYSRGGMNAYQVSKLTDNINSVAVVGAPTNKFESIKFRENMYHNVYKPLFGDTINNREEYIKRSPIFWHEKINEPLLILHGSDDNRVAMEEAQQLIDSLKLSNKKDFKFKIFDGGNHILSNVSKRDSLIINWFKLHSK